MTSLCRQHLSQSVAAFGAALANRDLRRLSLALLASETSAPAYAVALYVFAFQQGGTTAVGLVGLVTMLPAALAAPFAALVADRARRERVMLAAALARGLLLALATAVAVLELPACFLYGVAALASIPSRVSYPARAALLPSLTRSERELAAANAVATAIENLGTVAGPVLAGSLLALLGPAAVFAAAAGTSLLSALALAGISSPERPYPAAPTRRVGAELAAGFRAIAGCAPLRLVVGLFTALALVVGVLGVLTVGLAIDKLGLGESGVGLLSGALGIGGLLGGAVALGLVSRMRLGADLRLGTLLLGLPIALVGLWPHAAAAVLLLALAGIGNVVFDVASYTLIQRTAVDDVRARVFGVLESLAVGAVALGSLGAILLVELTGIRGALVVIGCVPPLLALLAWRALDRLDERDLAPRETEPDLATA